MTDVSLQASQTTGLAFMIVFLDVFEDVLVMQAQSHTTLSIFDAAQILRDIHWQMFTSDQSPVFH